MCISTTECNIVKLLFHPRIIKSLKKYRSAMKETNKHHHRIEFAGKRQSNPTADVQLSEWINQYKLHTLAGNWGVVDVTDTHVLALDMVLARPRVNSIDKIQLIMCNVVVDCNASKHDIQRAFDHTCKIHKTLNNFYHIRCRSVLLLWGVGNSFSEVWF